MSCTAEGQPGNPAKTSEATATMAIVKPMIGHRTIKPPGTWAKTDDGRGRPVTTRFRREPAFGVSSDLDGRSSRPNGDDKPVSGVMNHPDVGLALIRWLDGVVDPDDIWPAPAAVSSPLDLRHPVVCPGGWAHSLQAGVDPLRRAPTRVGAMASSWLMVSFGAGSLRSGFRRTSSAHVVLSRLPAGVEGFRRRGSWPVCRGVVGGGSEEEVFGPICQDEDAPTAEGMDGKRMADSDGVSTLMHANLFEVFGQRDPGLRREAMGRTYAEDIVFTDPEGTVHGYDAVDEQVRKVLDKAPETFVFASDGPLMSCPTRPRSRGGSGQKAVRL